MKAILKITFLSYYMLTVVYPVFSQINYLNEKILSGLSIKDKERLENAEEARIYGDELMSQAEATESGYGLSMFKKEDYAADKIRKMDDKTINVIRSSVRKKIQASNQYGNANILVSFVYTKDLKKLLMQSADFKKENINILLEQSNYLLSKGRTIRGRSMRLANEFLVYPQLIDANEIEKLAIDKLIEAYGYIYKGADNIEVIYNDVPEANNIKRNTNAYFQIQLAATKKPLHGEQLRQLTPGNEALSREFKNGWYKYSISRDFGTYQKAVDYKKSMRLDEAFIIAFVDGKRVSVSEAILHDGQASKIKTEREPTGITYRLRLWISTQPATNEMLSGIKSGGKPIRMHDHGGWYTYTIGDFYSQQEANSFKRNNGLTDAVLLKYKNGTPTEND